MLCTHTQTLSLLPWSSMFQEEGHGAKGREEGRGQVEWHQEQGRTIRKGNYKHGADGNSICTRTAQTACKPPNCSSDLLYAGGCILCKYSAPVLSASGAAAVRGEGLNCRSLGFISISLPQGEGGYPEKQQEQMVSAPQTSTQIYRQSCPSQSVPRPKAGRGSGEEFSSHLHPPLPISICSCHSFHDSLMLFAKGFTHTR